MKAKVATGVAVTSLVTQVIRDTIKSLDGLATKEHIFVFSNRTLVAQPVDIVRWLSEHMPTASDVLHVRNVLINAVAAAESRQAGSGYIALVTALEILSSRDQDVLDKKIDRISHITKKTLEKSKRASVSEAHEILHSYDEEHATYQLAKNAIADCSSNAVLSIDIQGPKTEIKEISGHVFPCHLPETFLASAKFLGRRPVNDPRVIVIDGMVERMSEIENIIGGSHASREPLVLFARGYAPEVQHTLARNYSTGHLLAFPLVVPYDELGANLLGDISIVCNADPVSSFKGDLISSRQWKDLRSVEHIVIDSASVTLTNKNTAGAVRSHRKHLGEKRKTCSQFEHEIIDRRLQCLMGRGATISIGADAANLSGVYKDRISSHVRMFRSIGRHGIVKKEDMQVLLELKQYKRFMSRFDIISAAALAVGIKSGIACAKSVCGLGGVIHNAA